MEGVRRPRLLAAALVVAGVLVGGQPGSAHLQTYPYTLSTCPAAYDSQVDPINTVFWDSGSSSWALANIAAHAGWANTSGSTQYFSDHGTCRIMDGQRASACGLCDRFHVRVEAIADSDESWGVTSRGDAHHEDLVWYCGHAVDANGPSGSGFDQGRRELRQLLEAGGHGWQSRYWGNTRNFRQCDGDYAGSDGYTVFVRIGHTH
jgi:hypothetical protein